MRVEAAETDPEWLHGEPPEPDGAWSPGVAEKAEGWVPYIGPDGGEGWKNAETGRVRYTDEPPGDAVGLDQVEDPEIRAELEEAYEAAGIDPGTGDGGRDDGDGEPAGGAGRPGDDRLPGITAGDVESAAKDRLDPYLVETATREGEVSQSEPWASDRRFGDDQPGELLDAIEEEARSRMDAGAAEAAVADVRSEVMDNSPAGPRYEDNSAPDHLDPSRADRLATLGENGDAGGMSVDSMRVAKMPDGSDVYVTKLGEGDDRWGMEGEEPDRDGKAAMASHAVVDSLLGPDHKSGAPDHHHEEGRFLAVEGADGDPGTSPDAEGAADGDAFLDLAAALLLSGNMDMHIANFTVDAETGGAQAVDLDKGGYDLGDHSGNRTQAKEKLADSAEVFGVEPSPFARSSHGPDALQLDISIRATELAESRGDEESLDRMLEGVDPGLADNVRSNFEAAKREEL